ncbi:unnamed protein product [Onchocerca flexuosa]|uniref:Uncharacterized protein n=1 Tax=Onchocerca flexuosa TaxID=387005 RepID=A0A183HUS9_9BILA|nr:unnamed protein product [Onchocerca flexuosa]
MCVFANIDHPIYYFQRFQSLIKILYFFRLNT